MPLIIITASQAATRVSNSSAFKNAVEFLNARISAESDLGNTSYTYDKQAHQLSADKLTQLKNFLIENGFSVTEPSSAVFLISWPNS